MLSQNDGTSVEKSVVGVADLVVRPDTARGCLNVPWIVSPFDVIDSHLPGVDLRQEVRAEGHLHPLLARRARHEDQEDVQREQRHDERSRTRRRRWGAGGCAAVPACHGRRARAPRPSRPDPQMGGGGKRAWRLPGADACDVEPSAREVLGQCRVPSATCCSTGRRSAARLARSGYPKVKHGRRRRAIVARVVRYSGSNSLVGVVERVRPVAIVWPRRCQGRRRRSWPMRLLGRGEAPVVNRRTMMTGGDDG